MDLRSCTLALAAGAMLTAGAATAGDLSKTRYIVTDLGTFGGELSNGIEINEAGQVTGVAEIPNFATKAFLWTDGVLLDLGALNEFGTASTGRGLNIHGHVVGGSLAPDPQFPGMTDRPAFWSPETGMIEMAHDIHETSGAGRAEAINDHGVATGQWRGKPFRWTLEDGMTLLPVLPGSFFQGASTNAINNDGVIVGTGDDSTAFNKPVYWTPEGTPVQLPTLGGRRGEIRGLNNHGVMVGETFEAEFGPIMPTLWIDGDAIALGLLDDPLLHAGSAEDINDHGVIVGWDFSFMTGVLQAGWVRGTDGVKRRIDDMVDGARDGDEWIITVPLSINNAGQITGLGILIRDGIEYPGRAFLLSPVETGGCAADLDGDGAVGSSDLSILLGNWGASGGPADHTGDGADGSADLAELLGAWGACP